MSHLKKYIYICNRFHNYNIPKISYKELNQKYKDLYQDYYGIEEEDVNKTTFVLFIVVFIVTTIVSLVLIPLNFFIIIICSLFLSTIITYKFNLIIFNEINQKEKRINALLYLIKLNYSMIQQSFSSNTDYCLKFIELIKYYDIPVFDIFNKIFERIHEGYSPEEELNNLNTPSKDFDNLISDLIVNNFNNNIFIDKLEENESEKHFRIYLKAIETKISIVFFVGLFFPIGLCFYILFSRMQIIFFVIIVPLFLFLFNYLFKKLLNTDTFLIGLLKDYSNLEKRRFNEFLIFLKGFAIRLERNNSPEKAFIETYLKNENNLIYLKKAFNQQISNLLNFSYSFGEMMDNLATALTSIRFNLILGIIKEMVERSAYHSSTRINQLLQIINKHKKLENKLDLIIRGEKFKLFIFLFMLPLIIGALGGTLHYLTVITNNFNFQILYSIDLLKDFSNILNILIIFLILLSCNTITSFYYLKIISLEKRYYIIFISDLLFITAFMISYYNIVSLI